MWLYFQWRRQYVTVLSMGVLPHTLLCSPAFMKSKSGLTHLTHSNIVIVQLHCTEQYFPNHITNNLDNSTWCWERLQEIFSKYPLCKDIDTIYTDEVHKITDWKLQKEVDESTDSVIELFNRKINTVNLTLCLIAANWKFSLVMSNYFHYYDLL